MAMQLTRQHFEPLIGQKFTLTTPDAQTVDLSLVDVAELPAPARRGRKPLPETVRREPFSIYFTAAPLLPQATYPIANEALGAEPLPIFIVPIGKADEGYEYEAVFT